MSNKLFSRSLIFGLFLLCFAASAQDERYFRELFTDKIKNKDLNIDTAKRKVSVNSPFYQIDLNNDGLPESLVTAKRDGEDWFEIYNFRGTAIFKTQLQATGVDSAIYKVTWSKISEETKVLIIHFYEGYTKSTKFEGIARLYFITIDKNDLKTLAINKGPHFWHEFEKPREIFWRRNYRVNVLDYNNDGQRDISVSYKTITRTYNYSGNGRWLDL